MNSIEDTIAAIATPIGEGGISVIRISGDKAIEVADKCFRGKQPLTASASHTAHFGHFYNTNDELLDEVVATIFRKPHSYTAEDVVEISCHGGLLVTREILETTITSGARIAEPGEFTKRSFLNGRIDLSQAEAVSDLIKAKSEISHRMSILQLEGVLAERINEIKEKLLNTCSYLELELDFIEEGVELTKKDETTLELKNVINGLTKLAETFRVGKTYKEGVKAAIVGKPNVGKSSILNALLNSNRAIVTEIPGTTRDTIEENLIIEGILFKIVDTAGLRASSDVVELEGLKRTHEEIKTTDINLYVIDASEEFQESDKTLFYKSVSIRKSNEQKVIIVFNKIDLIGDENEIGNDALLSTHRQVKVSAKTGIGLDSLRKEMINQTVGSRPVGNTMSPMITNLRHFECIQLALKSLQFALEGLIMKKSNEFITIDLRAAMNDLSEITGVITSEDILNNIFSKFCIGK